jgi:hypothetical protein
MRNLEVQRTSSTLCGVSRMIGFTFSAMLVIALVWTATAHAQRPTDDEYEKLKVNERLKAAPAQSGPEAPDASVEAEERGGEPLRGKAEERGGEPLRGKADPGGGKAPVIGLRSSGVLPATGGLPILVMIFVGGALTVSGGAGLMLLRRSGRGR